MRHSILIALACLGLIACDDNAAVREEPIAQSTTAGDVMADPLETWLGRWNGPEGTFLDIARDGAQFDVTIRDLDAEKKYSAIEQDGTLQFMRDDVGEAIRPGTGMETGMKWLAEKKNCLIVKAGEGYCRD